MKILGKKETDYKLWHHSICLQHDNIAERRKEEKKIQPKYSKNLQKMGFSS